MVDLPLETERLLLRDFEESDWRAVHVYASDPLVVRYLEWGPNTEDQTKEFIQRTIASQKEMPRAMFEFAIVQKEDRRLIGGCRLRVNSVANREGVVGYCCGQDSWGKGYATEAVPALLRLGFGPLGLHRIFAECDVCNVASVRVLEKVGMQREGRLRENMWYRGRWRDSFRYAVLEQEWNG